MKLLKCHPGRAKREPGSRAVTGPGIIAMAATLLLAACAATSDAPPLKQYESLAAPTPDGVATRITADMAGSTVAVKIGTTIAVELVGVPTAGYLWKLTEQPAFLEASGEYGGPTSSAQLEEGFAGGNHWEAFLFKVNAAGEGVLKLEQLRPWEDDTEPPADTFSVTLKADE